MMKHTLKSFFAVSLSAMMAISLLTACGNNQAPAGSASPAPSGSASSGQGKKLSVMATFYSMYDFASKIGGDKVTVTNMVPAGTEPHDWEPAASDITNLEKANVFVYSGAGMEHWVEDVRSTLENKNLVTVEASAGISLREGHQEDEEASNQAGHEEEEHEESGYDPHVWIAPLNAKIEMKNIKDALSKADPGNADYYAANYKTWSAACDKLDQTYKDALSGLSNKNIVVSHEAFGYLCDAYGLKQMGIEGLSPDSEPDPARMAEIQDFVKKNNVKVIFSEELVSPKVAQAIADATGAKVQMLNPLEGLSDEQLAAGDDYFSVMEKNLDALKAALQ